MNQQLQLVFNKDNEVYTTSLIVAEVFEKRHSDILRAIDNLQCSIGFRERNFTLSSYISEQNKEMPMVELHKDGLSMLIMGFTGEKAMIWKEKYIKAFNEMETRIRQLEKPKDLATLLIEAGEELRRKDNIIQEKETKLIEQTPKVEAYEAFLDTTNLMSMETFSKNIYSEFKLGRNNMFKKLRELEIIRPLPSRVPYQRYIDEGYFYVRSNVIPHSEYDVSEPQSFLTKKGVDWLYKRLKEELGKEE